jgi:hypothetical protein
MNSPIQNLFYAIIHGNIEEVTVISASGEIESVNGGRKTRKISQVFEACEVL